MFDLTRRRALVTGAGQGVGAGIAHLLASAGAAVATNDLHEARARAVAAEIEAACGKAIATAFDVADYDAAAGGIDSVESAAGPLDILVNNAGIPESMSVQRFRKTDPAAWRPYVDVNLFGVMNCSRAVINGMRKRGHGRIVTISSGAGMVGLNIGVS